MIDFFNFKILIHLIIFLLIEVLNLNYFPLNMNKEISILN